MMMLDWLRLWPELIRLNLLKARHRRRLVRTRRSGPPGPAPCQSSSDSGRARETRCEACHRFDRAHRYHRVCPDIVFVANEARCARDAAEVRPYWGRALAFFLVPLVVGYLAFGLAFWGVLRSRGLEALPPSDVLLPSRWGNIAEHRRVHFQKLALRALAAGDPATASISLVSATQTGRGTPESNRSLARLATLGGYHSLADDLHASTLAAHPELADELALAWHDDLLIGARPQALARLALEQLARPGAAREFWLRAFFESVRHPGVAAELSATAPVLPHPGLRPALDARAALDRGDIAAASDQLIAFSGLLPGDAARRFLTFSWLDAGDPARARAAALSTAHPAPPGEITVLAYALLQADRRPDEARAALRPLFSDAALRPLVLAALIRDPDPELLREFVTRLPATTDTEPRLQADVWLAARRAGSAELAGSAAARLAALGQPIPHELQKAQAASRAQLTIASTILPLDREILYALRARAEPGAVPGKPVLPK